MRSRPESRSLGPTGRKTPRWIGLQRARDYVAAGAMRRVGSSRLTRRSHLHRAHEAVVVVGVVERHTSTPSARAHRPVPCPAGTGSTLVCAWGSRGPLSGAELNALVAGALRERATGRWGRSRA